MKRWIFRVVLLLGAIVNVAVAWGFALRIAVTELEMDEAEAPYWYADGYAHAGRALRRSGTLVIDYSNIEATHREFNEYLTRIRSSAPEPIDQRSFPSGSLPFLIWQSGSHPSFKYGWEIANGWPFVALRYRMYLTEDDWSGEKPPVLHGGLKLSTSEVPLSSSFLTGRALPLRPIWPGLAINTVFYAAILWIPFAPFTVRRIIRRKRGHCIKCGYDLRGAEHEVCPECGAGCDGV